MADEKVNIHTWLKKFSKYWKNHKIDKVMKLFSHDVEYFETPFKKLPSITDLMKEWEGIKNQKEIELSFEVFSKKDNKYSVIWNLYYLNTDNVSIHWKGVYLIRLNSKGKCDYFFHCGEQKEK